MDTEHSRLVLDYRALRLAIGILALAMPAVVTLLGGTDLSSISASYYTDARDVYLGMLFLVAGLFWVYNGHSRFEANVSKVAAVTTVVIALCPSACHGCEVGWTARVHYVASALLLLILVYFCLVPFRWSIRKRTDRARHRARIYLVCGWIMMICLVIMLVANLFESNEMLVRTRITYWTETIVLVAFGVSWITAGKVVPLLVEPHEALPLFRRSAGRE